MRGSDLFVNYFADDTRDTPINVAAARVILGVYLLWRVASIDAVALMEWPVPIATSTAFFYPDVYPPLIIVAKWVCLIASVGFLVGYRMRASGFVTALSLSYLAAIRFTVNRSGETEQLFVAAYFVILFALFSQHDELSVDGFRRTASQSMEELNAHLKGDPRGAHRAPSLKWSLLIVAILYFGSGLVKVTNNPGLSWASAENHAGYITMWSFRFQREFPLGELIQQSDLLLASIGYGTVAIELTWPFVVLAGLTVTPFIVITLLMHVGIYLVLGLLFSSLMVFLCLFGAFDTAYKRVVSDREIDLVYDEHCYFCARSLSLFKLLDVNQTVTFYSQSDILTEHRERDDVSYEDEMVAFVEGELHGGYNAFRELLRQFRILPRLSL